MSLYEHDLDAANARIEELEATNTELVDVARMVQARLDKVRAENIALRAGKSQGADAAAKVAANLEAFRNTPLDGA